MHFILLDDTVSLTMNIFIIISIIMTLIYTISQIIKTYYYESTHGFSKLFIFLQIITNSIWISYFIEIDTMILLIPMLLNTTVLMFIAYYKSIELDRRRRKNNKQSLLYNYKKLNYNVNETETIIENNDNECGEWDNRDYYDDSYDNESDNESDGKSDDNTIYEV